MSEVKVAFKNVLDKRAVYKKIEGNCVSGVLWTYAREYCEDPEIYDRFIKEKITVKLNGKSLPVDDWTTTLVIDGDKILVTPALEGDNMGILGIILGAILIAVSLFFPGTTPFVIAGIAAQGTLFMMGAAMILGGLLSVLMQPDLPTFSPLSSKGSQTYSWQGIKTQARPDQPVPVVYGKHIIGGNLISIFTEREGAEDYLYMLVALCEGEIEGIATEDNSDNICTTSDPTNAAYKHPWITLNDQPLQNYTNLEWWYRTGTNLPNAAVGLKDPLAQNQIPNFNGSRMQIDDGRQITQDGIVFTTTKDVDMAIVQTRFPSLFDATAASIVSTLVHYGIQYRVNGTDTWYNYTVRQYTPTVTPQPTSGNYPNSWGFRCTTYASGYQGLNRDNTRIVSDLKPDSFHVEVTIASRASYTEFDPFSGATTRTMEGPTVAYQLTIKNLTTNQMYTESVDFNNSVYYDNSSWGSGWRTRGGTAGTRTIQIGQYNVILTNNVNLGDAWLLESTGVTVFWIPIEAKTKTGLWDSQTLDFHTLPNGSGKDRYDLRMVRQEPISSDFKIANNSMLRSVIEVVNGDFIYPNTALVGFKIKATGQLSGSPPNVNILIKGTKIAVPNHSGSERFEEIYWDEDDSRWEYNGAVRTWDGSTYTTEYSNNSMLCLRDLMLNKRYGLGEYIVGADLSSANVTSIIKECHKIYVPTEGDYLSWWDAGFEQEFVKHIGDPWGGLYPNTLSINATAENITYSDAYTHYIPLVLDAPLKSGQRYQISIALTGTTKNVDIDIGLRKLQWGARYKGYWYQLGNYQTPELSDKGDGVHTFDFTAPFAGANRVLLVIKKNGGAANCNGTVDDISISKIVGSGTARGWRYHTFNGVFDSPQAALSTLLEFTNSFRVWPSWFEGTFKFIMDKDETPIHTLAISNTTSFSQTWVPLSEIPYRIVGQFTDEDQNYVMNQLMVQSTDDTLTKANETTIGLKGITNRKRVEREVKFRLAKFTNSTHTVNIKCGLDMIHATAGDIINVSNDLPSWGHGTRVASWNEGSKYLYLVDPYTVLAGGADTMAKYMDANNNFQTATVNLAGASEGDVLRRLTLKSWPGTPVKDAVTAIGLSTSYVKKFRLLSVTRSTEDEVEITALEHIDTLYGSEPVLKVTQDHETEALDAAVGVPDAPINIEIVALSAEEGIGFEIYAEHANMRSQEIIVEFSEIDADSTYVKIGTIGKGQTTIKYINNKLAMDRTYRFRLTSVGLTGTSPAIYQDVYLPKTIYKVPPVTGMQIKGNTPLVQTWDGLDVTIAWNPVGQNLIQSGLMDFYTIYVYNTSYDPNDQQTNLLRVAYPKDNEYKYTYDMNLEDSGETVPYSSLIFLITANLVNGVESERSRPFLVSNAAPTTPLNLNSEAWSKKARFFWQPNKQTDFKHFEYRTRLVDDTLATPLVGTWAGWTETGNTEVVRSLTATEQTTYGDTTLVRFNVKAVDLYETDSAVASIAQNVVTLNVGQGDITDFSIKASMLFTKIPILDLDNWANNNPSAGYINWDDHFIYYNGASYLIASSNTNKTYIWWEFGATQYSASNTNPASILDPDDFIISTNINGDFSLAWNKVANQVIGNAYIADAAINTAKIQDLAVTNAKIASLNADKITTGFLSGGRIEAGTITATMLTASSVTTRELRGDDFGVLNITSGKIIFETAATSGIIISQGFINIIANGGDLRLNGADPPAWIQFMRNNSATTWGVRMGYHGGLGGNYNFAITAATSALENFYVGLNINGAQDAFKDIRMRSINAIALSAIDDNAATPPTNAGISIDGSGGPTSTTIYAQIRKNKIPKLKIWAFGGATGEYAEFDDVDDVRPDSAGTRDLGTSTRYWNEINYKDLTDRGCLGWFDEGVELNDGRIVDDLAAIQEIKPDGRLERTTRYGKPMLDYRTLPKSVYKKAVLKHTEGNSIIPIETVLPRDEMDLPYAMVPRVNASGIVVGSMYEPAEDGAELTALVSIMLGAIKQLDRKINKLASRTGIDDREIHGVIDKVATTGDIK